MSLLQIKKFEDLLSDFNSRLTSYGSQITNRQEGGAFDLTIRVECLQVADAYALMEQSLPQVFPVLATETFLDYHGESVGLTREAPQKTQKEFILTRDSDSGVVQIPVGDTLKTPVLPSRGQLRFIAIPVEEVDLTGTATASAAYLEDSAADFITDGVKLGSYLFNVTDGSYGSITAIEKTKLTAELKGGSTNLFASGDSYKTTKPSSYAGEFTTRSATATTGSTGETLKDSNVTDFTALKYLQLGQKVYNITDGSSGNIIQILTDQVVCDALTGGTNNYWTSGDEYKFQTDFQITVLTEARFEGTEPNNMEEILGRAGEQVECEADSGFTGVDHILSTGEDYSAGTDLETDKDFRTRILNRWKELARGSTRDAYRNFARSSSPVIFDANPYKGTGATDVNIVLSGVPGSRNISSMLGIKVNPNDNFDSLYTDDGTSGGLPMVLGITVHEYIRARAPLTDIIYLSSVESEQFNAEIKITVIDGFVFEAVKQELLKRFRALFLVEKSVKDVETIKVGETLLFSRLSRLVANTAGVADFHFISPDPNVNFGDTIIAENKVFTMGTISIEEI